MRPRDGSASFFVRCGQCLACRQARASTWATRLDHESKYWDKSIFVTLTYKDEELPKDHGLDKDEAQKFIKRLRKHVSPIRYFLAGEYGSITFRPHYHAIIFGVGSSDHISQVMFDGACVATSGPIVDAWQLGNVVIGDVNRQSAGYVAQYVLQKLNGKLADHVYSGRQKPFQLYSMGLGNRYVDDHLQELVDNPLLRNGPCEVAIPRAYRKKLEDLGHSVTEVYRDFAYSQLKEVYEYHKERGRVVEGSHYRKKRGLDLVCRKDNLAQSGKDLAVKYELDSSRKEL